MLGNRRREAFRDSTEHISFVFQQRSDPSGLQKQEQEILWIQEGIRFCVCQFVFNNLKWEQIWKVIESDSSPLIFTRFHECYSFPVPTACTYSCRAIIHIYLFLCWCLYPWDSFRASLCLSPLPEELRQALPSILSVTCAAGTKSLCSTSHIPRGNRLKKRKGREVVKH